jgi:hypothetical protein
VQDKVAARIGTSPESHADGDVPFDVRHVRVIYYELTDPFWGQQLIAKVAENIISAIKNPHEAMLFPLRYTLS